MTSSVTLIQLAWGWDAMLSLKPTAFCSFKYKVLVLEGRLKYIYQTDKCIAIKDNEISEFQARWSPLKDL